MGMEGSKATGTVSKRRYDELKERLLGAERMGVVDVENVLRVLCEVCRFDPGASRYTPEFGRRMMEARRRRASELGMTEYEMRKGEEVARRVDRELVRT